MDQTQKRGVAVDQQSLTEQLARYWSGARYEDLPAPVVAMAKSVLLDTLSVGVRGAESEVAVATRKGITSALECSSGSASLWGTNLSLPPSAAALVNGTASHAYEFDDYGGCGHSGAVVVPAVCAMAERSHADGRSVIVALVAAYDVAARVTEGAGGYRAHNDLGWHSTGTCGTFGAAAGASSILGLDATRFTSALGLTGSYAGGTWAFLVDGAMSKRFHPGRSSENGVSAALLAEAGLVGPRFILEAEWGGFYKTYAGAVANPEATVAALGREFRILQTGQKPFPVLSRTAQFRRSAARSDTPAQNQRRCDRADDRTWRRPHRSAICQARRAHAARCAVQHAVFTCGSRGNRTRRTRRVSAATHG